MKEGTKSWGRAKLSEAPRVLPANARSCEQFEAPRQTSSAGLRCACVEPGAYLYWWNSYLLVDNPRALALAVVPVGVLLCVCIV